MTSEEKKKIEHLQSQGLGYKRIASTLGLSVNGVKSFCRRHPAKPSAEGICPVCGAPVVQTPHRKQKKFCSDKCRMVWWKAHPELLNRKAIYHLVCAYCGQPFDSYGNNRRKYCSRRCYDNARRKAVE
ncbi:MAG: RNA polymerase subunit sigma-70 [Ruminococcus flavefaciens]|nr:RNA polymerase subunit sigma-70 [Ruminococcus flavefaciens]